MTPNKRKLKELTDRMLSELDDEGCRFAWYCLNMGADRLFMEAEVKKLRAQAATAAAPQQAKKPRKVKLGGNAVAFKGNDPAA